MATRAKTRGNVKPPPKPRARVDVKPIISALYEMDPRDLDEQGRSGLRNAAAFFIARCKQAQKPTGG